VESKDGSSEPKASCSRCLAGYVKKDSTHDHGCPNRWLTFGESFDEMSYDDQWDLFATFRLIDIKCGEGHLRRTFEEFSASLYRPKGRR
jgi:hypothetical protein